MSFLQMLSVLEELQESASYWSEYVDKVEQAGAIVYAIGECTLCKRNSDDVYQVKFANQDGSEVIHNFKICYNCMEQMGDLFSEWIPMFCVNCHSGGWAQKNDKVPYGTHVGFVDGCSECTGICVKGWWLGHEQLLC